MNILPNLYFKIYKIRKMFSEDFSLTTFSSKGKLDQIEYALEAVNKAETALGIPSHALPSSLIL